MNSTRPVNFYSIVLILLVGALISPASALEQPEPLLADLADQLCVTPDGDHRMTWQYAERDGFSLLRAEDFPGLTTPSVHGDTLRGFAKTIDGRELRVLTGASFISAPDQGITYYRWCWVWASPDRLDGVVRTLQSRFDTRGFRNEKVRLFAWIPRPDEVVEPVSRRRYLREHNALAREQGMRQVMVRQVGDGVSIGYASPRDEATYREFDWAGPEPVPVPE